MSTKLDLIYQVNDRPRSWFDRIVYSLQWVFIMFYGVVFAYSTLASGLNLSPIELSDFLARVMIGIGVSTLAQSLFGHKLAMMSGPNIITNIALLTSFTIDGIAGFSIVLFSFVLSGILLVIIIRVGLLNRILSVWTDLVSGSMVLMVGLVISISGMQSLLASGSGLDFIIGLALGLFCAIISLFGKKTIASISLLITIVLGYVIFSMTGSIDWTVVKDSPNFIVPKLVLVSNMSLPSPGILSVIVLVTILSLINLFGNVNAYSSLVGERINNANYRRSFYVFALVEIVLMALFKAPPTVPYGENLGFISSTKNASRYFIIVAAVAFVFLGFFGKFIALISLMPSALSGAIMFGVASSCIGLGISTISTSPNFDATGRFIVSISIFVSLGLSQSSDQLSRLFSNGLAMILSNGILMVIMITIVLERIFVKRKENINEKDV